MKKRITDARLAILAQYQSWRRQMYEWTDQYEALLLAHCRLGDGVTCIQSDTRFALLGIDSMEIVSLVVDLEDMLGIEFPEDLLTPEVFATPGTLWDALANRRLA